MSSYMIKRINFANEPNKCSIDTPNRKSFLVRQSSGEIKTFIGKGSYGTVLRATYKEKPVAVKVIRKALSLVVPNEKYLQGLCHDNIVRIRKIVHEDHQFIIIMEQLHGDNLQNIISSISLNIRTRLQILLQLSEALVYCHSKDLLHLDVKPANLVLCPNYHEYCVKLCDFGNALQLGKEDRYQIVEELQGTIPYMAPEMIRSRRASKANDVYSFGIVMWQMQTGEQPYRNIDHSEQIMYLVVTNNLRPDHLTEERVRTNLNSRVVNYLEYQVLPRRVTFTFPGRDDHQKSASWPKCTDLQIDSEQYAGEGVIIDWEYVFLKDKSRTGSYNGQGFENKYGILYKMCWDAIDHCRPTMRAVRDIIELYLSLL